MVKIKLWLEMPVFGLNLTLKWKYGLGCKISIFICKIRSTILKNQLCFNLKVYHLHIPFLQAFSAMNWSAALGFGSTKVSCVFKELTLVDPNQDKVFENAPHKPMRKQDVAIELTCIITARNNQKKSFFLWKSFLYQKVVHR